MASAELALSGSLVDKVSSCAVSAGRDIDNRDADIVRRFVNQEMNHGDVSPFSLAWADSV